MILIRNSSLYIRTTYLEGSILRRAESTTGKAGSVKSIERNAILTNGEWGVANGVRHRPDIDASSFAGERSQEGPLT